MPSVRKRRKLVVPSILQGPSRLGLQISPRGFFSDILGLRKPQKLGDLKKAGAAHKTKNTDLDNSDHWKCQKRVSDIRAKLTAVVNKSAFLS